MGENLRDFSSPATDYVKKSSHLDERVIAKTSPACTMRDSYSHFREGAMNGVAMLAIDSSCANALWGMGPIRDNQAFLLIVMSC